MNERKEEFYFEFTPEGELQCSVKVTRMQEMQCLKLKSLWVQNPSVFEVSGWLRPGTAYDVSADNRTCLRRVNGIFRSVSEDKALLKSVLYARRLHLSAHLLRRRHNFCAV